MSFKINLNKASGSSNKKFIEEEIQPSFSYFKELLKTGGSVNLTNSNKPVEINIAENFLTSKNEPKLQFTNFVNLNEVPDTTQQTLKKIIGDISYICKNTEEVSFKDGNREKIKRLRKILKLYREDEIFSEGNNLVFKVDGVPYYEKNKRINPFRIYLKIDFTDPQVTVYDLMLCDIYHLCIPTDFNGKLWHKVMSENYLTHRYSCQSHLKEVVDDIN